MRKTILFIGLFMSFYFMNYEHAYGNSDECMNEGQRCVCQNTGWNGGCYYGFAKEGLYCQCVKSACPPKSANHRVDEGPRNNACNTDYDCDGCRYCSSTGWNSGICQGIAR